MFWSDEDDDTEASRSRSRSAKASRSQDSVPLGRHVRFLHRRWAGSLGTLTRRLNSTCALGSQP